MSEVTQPEIDAAMRFIDEAREAVERMIAGGTTPVRVAIMVGVVLAEAIMRSEPGHDGMLIRAALESAVGLLDDNGRPLNVRIATLRPEPDAGEVRH